MVAGVVILALMIAAGIGSAPVIDSVAGEEITPDNPLYVMEKFGEQIKLSVGMEKHLDLAVERLEELDKMARLRERKQAEVRVMINESDKEFEYAGKFDTGEIKLDLALQKRTELLQRIRERFTDKTSIDIDKSLVAPLKEQITESVEERKARKEMVEIGG